MKMRYLMIVKCYPMTNKIYYLLKLWQKIKKFHNLRDHNLNNGSGVF